MAVAESNVASPVMAKTLCARVTTEKIRIAGIWEWRTHKLVRSSGILAVAKQRRFGRVAD
jgi:hypothetical protein